MKRRIVPGEVSTSDLHQYLLGSVSPRPIAFVSTINEDGKHNLAPYSFFYAFSSNLLLSSLAPIEEWRTIPLKIHCIIFKKTKNV